MTTAVILGIIAGSALFLALIAIIAAVYSTLIARRIRQSFSLLSAGKKADDLEGIILENARQAKEMDQEIQELFEISNKINALARQGLHRVGTIRFNPFKDIGGNQSFSTALLDDYQSGIVITSLHTRESSRVYLKPVVRGKSDPYPLTEEEKQAIKIATPAKKNAV